MILATAPTGAMAQSPSCRLEVVAIDFGVYGAPESFLIDGEGRILYKHIGPLDWASVERELFGRLAGAPIAGAAK
mgnify:CR=1 FL=1